jgi:hypothetical protein
MVLPAVPIIAAGLGAAGSVAGGWLANKGAGKETKIQKKQRKLIDQLMASLNGEGPYADLYKFDQDSFNKSFVEPAKNRFNNQIAPQIQQNYIASGQQRGTGLDDTLTRAGVDMNDLLNQYMMDYQEAGKNRMQNTMSQILGAGSGPSQMSGSNAAAQGGGGYLTGEGFKDDLGNIMQTYKDQNPNDERQYSHDYERPRTGYWGNS